jgi:hypothetical protein
MYMRMFVCLSAFLRLARNLGPYSITSDSFHHPPPELCPIHCYYSPLSLCVTSPIIARNRSRTVNTLFLTFLFVFRWTIKARITVKSDIRKWSNAKGDGHLFSIDLVDSVGMKRGKRKKRKEMRDEEEKGERGEKGEK